MMLNLKVPGLYDYYMNLLYEYLYVCQYLYISFHSFIP